MRKNQLDEMQEQRRNRIGNQSFMLLFYLLLADMGLSGAGVKWLNYPLNIYAIMMTCMTIYLIRLLMNNAYVGPRNDNARKGRKTIFMVVIAAFISSIAIFLTQKGLVKTQAADGNDNGAIILFVISMIFLVITYVISAISKKQNSKGEE